MTKRLLALGAGILALLSVTGCNKNEPQLLDPMAKVTINVEESAPRASETSTNPNHYSPQELVEKSFAMLYIVPGTSDRGGINGTRDSQLSLPPEYKDIPNAKFKLFGEWIIARRPDGSTYLSDHLFTATDCRFVEAPLGTDTNFEDLKIIGYLPREVMEKAWKQIKIAYDAGDYSTVYKLFEEAMVAYPCTPEEYAELKAQGKV